GEREERLGTGGDVRLVVPAAPEYLRLVRLTAAGMASRLGFTFDEVEDLRIAVDELCFHLLGGVDGDPSDEARTMDLTYSAGADSGDKVLRDEIVGSQVGLAEYLARRFKNRGEPIEDLIQVALLGLLKAVERFDPSRGLEFSTFATPTIVGELKRHFRDKGW